MKSNIYPILIDGSEELSQVCDPIEQNSPDLQTIIQRMFVTLDSTPNGVGLSAPQIGLPVRMFILGKGLADKVFINPEIIKAKGSRKKDMEGCLSVPHVYARVDRYNKVKVKYLDHEFEEQVESFSGFMARVIQHEVDHLDGIMFYEKITDHERKFIQSRLDKIQRGDIPEGLDYVVKLNDGTLIEVKDDRKGKGSKAN